MVDIFQQDTYLDASPVHRSASASGGWKDKLKATPTEKPTTPMNKPSTPTKKCLSSSSSSSAIKKPESPSPMKSSPKSSPKSPQDPNFDDIVSKVLQLDSRYVSRLLVRHWFQLISTQFVFKTHDPDGCKNEFQYHSVSLKVTFKQTVRKHYINSL